MPNIVSSVMVVQQQDLQWNVSTSTHPALAGKLFYRNLGGMLEVRCQSKLTSAITSGAVLGTISLQCLPAFGTVNRYTADTDTTPDVRRCNISADGVLTNSSGLAFNAGHTLDLRLITQTA